MQQNIEKWRTFIIFYCIAPEEAFRLLNMNWDTGNPTWLAAWQKDAHSLSRCLGPFWLHFFVLDGFLRRNNRSNKLRSKEMWAVKERFKMYARKVTHSSSSSGFWTDLWNVYWFPLVRRSCFFVKFLISSLISHRYSNGPTMLRHPYSLQHSSRFKSIKINLAYSWLLFPIMSFIWMPKVGLRALPTGI